MYENTCILIHNSVFYHYAVSEYHYQINFVARTTKKGVKYSPPPISKLNVYTLDEPQEHVDDVYRHAILQPHCIVALLDSHTANRTKQS